MRRIAIVSVGRSDRGHLAPLVSALGDEATLVEFDKPVGDQKPLRAFTDTAYAMARTSASAVGWFAAQWETLKPDLVVLFGDRYEVLAAALASLPFVLPLAHIHGGETTTGVYDNQIRHALTKLSHLHFVSHRRHGARVYRMGEARWRIHVTGAPGLDRIPATPAHSREQLATRWDLDPSLPWVLVTLHPETLNPTGTAAMAAAMCQALADLDVEYVITKPGPDTSYHAITNRLLDFCREHKRARIVVPDDSEYLSLMAHAACMVGNSSSGIIEAPTLRLPVVNIGDRQKGRLRGGNVVDVDARPHAIKLAVGWFVIGLSAPLAAAPNPYGDGHAAERIAKVLREIPLDRRLLEKR